MKPDALLGALGLCRKAGALAVGFDAAKQSAAKGNAALLLLASDLSPGSQKRILEAARGVPHHLLPFTQHDIATITQKPAGILAVCNQDLAALCLAKLQPEEETI